MFTRLTGHESAKVHEQTLRHGYEWNSFWRWSTSYMHDDATDRARRIRAVPFVPRIDFIRLNAYYIEWSTVGFPHTQRSI